MPIYFLLLLFLCSSLISAFDYEKPREALLREMDKYLSNITRTADSSIKSFILNQTMKSDIFINTVPINEFIESNMKSEVFHQIKPILEPSHPDGIEIISHKYGSFESSFGDIIGTVYKEDNIISYYIYCTDIKTYFVQGIVGMEDCEEINGRKVCKKSLRYQPAGAKKAEVEKIEEYIYIQSLELIKIHIKQVQRLNGKIILSINEGQSFTSKPGSKYSAMLLNNGFFYVASLWDLLGIQAGKKNDLIQRPSYLQLGREFVHTPGDKLTLYITDDGNIYCLSFLATSIIWFKEIFKETNAKPYKFIFTEDADLITYDGNSKIIGTIKHQEHFSNVNYALPDGYSFTNKNGLYSVQVWGNNIAMFNNTIEENGEIGQSCFWKIDAGLQLPYNNSLISMSGYLVLGNDGTLKHINYENNKGVDWIPKLTVKGNGPYSLDITDSGELALINSKGEIYWTTEGITKNECIQKIHFE